MQQAIAMDQDLPGNDHCHLLLSALRELGDLTVLLMQLGG
jgi:hypothetical protein